jgi:hypothetical protein
MLAKLYTGLDIEVNLERTVELLLLLTELPHLFLRSTLSKSFLACLLAYLCHHAESSVYQRQSITH